MAFIRRAKFDVTVLFTGKVSASAGCVIVSIFLFRGTAVAQKPSISGYVKDAYSKEVLIGASVIIVNLKPGVTTTQYGFYSITSPVTDNIELIVSYNGYQVQAKKL
jgi:hypothetical protein